MLLVLILWSCTIFSQDSIVLLSSISEKKNLEFQEHFFNAITQKAINNHQKAIDYLEDCNGIVPNNKSILFELSKNYLELNKTPEALEYVNEALRIEPTNIWLLEHLVKIYQKDKNYKEAIAIQEKIAKKHPSKKQNIVYLHLKNNDKKAAKKVLAELAEAKLLNTRLRNIQERLTKVKKVKPTLQKDTMEASLEEAYVKDKSFEKLKKVLHKLDAENNKSLLKYSDEGLGLFPAQPLVYLMNGKALNNLKEYNKAIKTLQNGIDFVIDDVVMEKAFYTQLLNAYTGLGDGKNIDKYRKKI